MKESKNARKHEPEHLAEKYSKYGKIFLIFSFICAAVTIFCISFASYLFRFESDIMYTLVFVFLITCSISSFFLPIFSISYYARADFYKSLLDGKQRQIRWLYYSFYFLVLFIAFLIIAFSFEPLSEIFFIFSIFTLLISFFLSIGYFECDYERKKYLKKHILYNHLLYGETEERTKIIGMIYLLFASEILALSFLFFLFIHSIQSDFLFGLSYLFLVCIFIVHIKIIYSRYLSFLRRGTDSKLEVKLENFVDIEKGSSFQRTNNIFNSLLMLSNYSVWIVILYTIKTVPLPVNCAGAWIYVNPHLPTLLLGIFLEMFFIYIWTNPKKIINLQLMGTIFMVYLVLFLSLFFSTGVAALCECNNPALITKTYVDATVVFAMDTAIKAMIATKLLDKIPKRKK